MKKVLASLSLIYSLTVSAQSLLVVQSAQIHDLYGNSIVNALILEEGVEHVDVFHARLFINDASEYSSTNLRRVLIDYVKNNKPDKVLFLGEPELDIGVPVKYSSIIVGGEDYNTTSLTALRDYDPAYINVYIISGPSHVSQLRKDNLVQRLEGFEVSTYTVTTVLDFQKRLLALQEEPKGVLVLNAFTLLDEWKQDVGYPELENLFVSVNAKHLDVGLCRRKFKTTFGLGPTPKEAAELAMDSYHNGTTVPHISSCANLSKVKKRWLPVYRKAQGKFDIVIGGYE